MDKKRPKISLAVPYHDSPKTAFFLSRLLKSISEQTFTDYEIVLTKESGMAHNHNEAILRSKGELIKIMQSDDYFAHPDALKEIVENFKGEWMINACLHTDGNIVGNPHMPYWTDDIFTGNNRLGSISTLTIRNETRMLFNEYLSWVVDVDLYKRYRDRYGLPTILENPAVVIDVGTHRLSHTLSDKLKAEEVEYLIRKYDPKTV